MSRENEILLENMGANVRPRDQCPTLPGYGDGNVFICILTPLMTTTCFKAVTVMISSELYS
jgi:hypothetical protein